MTKQKAHGWAQTLIRLVNHDFCPSFNRYVYWLRRPIGWLVSAILFSILVGLVIGPQGYVMACAFSVFLILGLVWPWLSMKGIQCRIELPDGRLWEKQEATMIIKIRNHWPIPVYGLMVEGDFLQSITAHEERIAFALKQVPAFAESEYRIPFVPRRRGQLPTGPVCIKNGFPFGLHDISKPVQPSDGKLVWPARATLLGHPPADGCQLKLLGSLRDRSGNDGDVIGIRSYRQGDGLKSIHWAQTARSQRLMVRERQTYSSTSATVLLDLTPSGHAGEGVDNSFEWAIRIAAAVCYQLHQSQAAVRMGLLGVPTEHQDSIGNRYGIEGMMNCLAGLPTFDRSRELGSSMNANNEFRLPRSGQSFFVGTDRSRWLDRIPPDTDKLIIRLQPNFVSDETEADLADANWPTDSSILLTSPNSIPGELDLGWRRRFGNVAS